jgi:excisionase family DNA binding protein
MAIQPVSRLGLTTSQAARELGVSLGTIRRWADLGYLRAYRTPGGQRRFNVDQIESFVRSLEQRPGASEHELPRTA